MIAPDGTSGDIPTANTQKAIAAGFKPATRMVAPTGEEGYIPNDRISDASNAGFKPVTGTAPIPQPDMKTALAPQLVRGTTALLPSAGAVGGGALASPGVVTAAAGAGLGAMAGKQAELLINRALFGKDEPSTISKQGLEQTGIAGAEGAVTGGAGAYAAANAASAPVASGAATLERADPAEWTKANQVLGATPKAVRFGPGIESPEAVTTNPGRTLVAKGLDADTLKGMTPFERLQAINGLKMDATAAVNDAAAGATQAGKTLDLEQSAFKTLGNIADDNLQTKAVDTLHKLVQQVGIDDVREATPQQALELRRLLSSSARFGPNGDLSSLATVRAQLYRAVTGDLHTAIPEMVPVDREATDLIGATDLAKNAFAKTLVKQAPSTIQMIMRHPVYGPIARGALFGATAGIPLAGLGYIARDYLRGLIGQ